MTIVLIFSLRKAYKKRQRMTSHVTSGSEDNTKEITLTLIIVVVVFIICHCLTPVRRILVMFYPDVSYQACGQFIFYFNTYIVMILEISSAVNVAIYMLCVKRYRKILRSICQAKIQPIDEVVLTSNSTNMNN